MRRVARKLGNSLRVRNSILHALQIRGNCGSNAFLIDCFLTKGNFTHCSRTPDLWLSLAMQVPEITKIDGIYCGAS